MSHPTMSRLRRLTLWLTDKEERRIYGAARWCSFRPPWSHLASIRMMREIGWVA